jgi:hypothetical protein
MGSYQRTYSLEWSAQEGAGLDQHWDLLEAVQYGQGTPFLIMPPDDRDGWLWVTMERALRSPVQDFQHPSASPGPTYTFRYELIENR